MPPPLKKRDFTLQQLKEFDGSDNGKRLLVAVNGKVFDVTKGRRFYGPGQCQNLISYRPGSHSNGNRKCDNNLLSGGPYSAFAGRDASRGLATFSVSPGSTDDYDDLSDLSPSEMEQVHEWELQFSEKYDLVGKLLRPGEEATSYSEEEDEDEDSNSNKKNA